MKLYHSRPEYKKRPVEERMEIEEDAKITCPVAWNTKLDFWEIVSESEFEKRPQAALFDNC